MPPKAAARLIALALAVVSSGAGAGLLVRREERRRAPAFDAGDLAEPAGANWPTAGGSLANHRYSTLDEIDTSNVKQLQGVWKTDLRGSGTEAKYSGVEPAGRLQRRDLCLDRQERRLRRRRRDRQDPLAVRGEPRPEDRHDLLRLVELWRRDRRRKGVPGTARRQGRRTRREDGRRRLDPAARPLGGRAGDHRGAGLCGRARVHRRRRSRPRHTWLPRGARP